jgi:FkbM family methyltransferase
MAERDAAQFSRSAVHYRIARDCQVRGLDAIYHAAFGPKDDGTFVEVGAYDGQSFSNTSFLADLGWRGLYVEPVPEFAARCATRHKQNRRVEVINSAIGTGPDPLRIHVAGSLSTGATDHLKAYAKLAWARPFLTERTIDVPVIRLDSLLQGHQVAPGFELLVIDVEGFEATVFETFDLDHWRPQVLIVELMDHHLDFIDQPELGGQSAALRGRIKGRSYREIYVNQINTVFLRDR